MNQRPDGYEPSELTRLLHPAVFEWTSVYSNTEMKTKEYINRLENTGQYAGWLGLLMTETKGEMQPDENSIF